MFVTHQTIIYVYNLKVCWDDDEIFIFITIHIVYSVHVNYTRWTIIIDILITYTINYGFKQLKIRSLVGDLNNI